MVNATIHWQPKLLQNDLVKLIPLKESDFEVLYKIASDPLLWVMHPKKERYKREVFTPFFKHAIERGSAFLILVNSTQEVIGSTGYYNYNAAERSIAVGYTFIARQYWGGPYNLASKNLLLNHAFQFVDKVYFYIGAGNYRSQSAISKIGAKKVRENLSNDVTDSFTEFEYLLEKSTWQNQIIKSKEI